METAQETRSGGGEIERVAKTIIILEQI